MRRLIIGLSRPTTWKPFSWAIQTALNTDYDHAYIQLEFPEYGRDIIFQASGLEVNFMSLDIFNSKETITNEWAVEVTDKQYIQIMNFFFSVVGRPYSIMDIVAIALFKIFGKKLLRGDGEKAFICSELVGYTMILAGIMKKEDEKSMDYFMPTDVYRVMQEYSKKN
jgi:hypothetical protein